MVANTNISKKIVVCIGVVKFLLLWYIQPRRTNFVINFSKSQKITICSETRLKIRVFFFFFFGVV